MVELLTQLGPDIPEISRRLGQFKESVRYRYKEKILKKGFAIQAAADHESLGLKRVILTLDFAEEYRMHAQSILSAMNELCFLVGFVRTLPKGLYVVNLSVPNKFVNEVKEFFLGMKMRGMFTHVEIYEFEWLRTVPMKARYFDFRTGNWNFDWTSAAKGEFESAAYVPSVPAKFDHVDLLIIKELQIDANKTLKSIADKLKLNYKKLVWHYKSHVSRRHLLRGYDVNWMGTRYDYAIDKARQRSHRYLAVDMLVKEPSQHEMMRLRQKLNQLPFMWAEASGRDYFAEFFLPVEFAIEALQSFEEAIGPLKNKVDTLFLDQTSALGFTIPYELHDESSRVWKFDRARLLGRFEQLQMRIKSEVT